MEVGSDLVERPMKAKRLELQTANQAAAEELRAAQAEAEAARAKYQAIHDKIIAIASAPE